MGRKHYQTYREWLGKGANTIELNTEILTAGIYQLEIIAENIHEVRKVIKQ